MADINLVTLLGSAGKDAEVSYVGKDNKALCKFSIATNAYTPQSGKGDTTWHNIVCWGKVAEVASAVRKGDPVFVQGTIITERWTGQDQKEKTKQSVLGKIVTRCVREKGGPRADEGSRQKPTPVNRPAPAEDDMPF